MQAVALENDVIRRFASGQMFPMAKLVLETAFQPIVEATTGTIFGYESLMRGHDRLGFPVRWRFSTRPPRMAS